MSTRRDLLVAGALGASPWLDARGQAETVLRLVNALYPPFVLPAGDPMGEGMDIELARAALAVALPKARIEVELMPWRRVLMLLENGQADLTTTISLSGDRRRFLMFSEGYRDEVRYHFYTRAESPVRVTQLSDLKPLSLGVSAGFFYPSAIKEATERPLVEAKDIETAVRMLNAGRSDVIVLNHLAGAWQIRKLGLEASLVRQPFHYSSGSPTHMAVSRGRPDAAALLKALDRGLRQCHLDGTQARIEKRYLG
jgi:polar amino acid transport system substrate-binding protein